MTERLHPPIQCFLPIANTDSIVCIIVKVLHQLLYCQNESAAQYTISYVVCFLFAHTLRTGLCFMEMTPLLIDELTPSRFDVSTVINQCDPRTNCRAKHMVIILCINSSKYSWTWLEIITVICQFTADIRVGSEDQCTDRVRECSVRCRGMNARWRFT